jgi:hypothetical protein
VPAGEAAVSGFEQDLFREYNLGNLPRFAAGVTLTQQVDGQA